MNAPVLDNVASLGLFVPELALSLGVVAVLLWDLVDDGEGKVARVRALALATLAIAAAFTARYLAARSPAASLFGGLVAFDAFGHVMRLVVFTLTAIVALFFAPRDGEGAPASHKARAEVYALLLTATLGASLMVTSRHLLMVYLAIELVSVMSFVLAGYKIDDKKSSEAALKYVVYGGVASGVMLYGMSYLYGFTQSLVFSDIATRATAATTATGHVPDAILVGVAAMLAGLGYKISAAPFHMWTPDVYEGAPTQVTAYLSVGPKAAGFGLILRFFATALGARDDGALATHAPWALVLGALAIATMTIGNLSALGQKNVKRMLAYSSIAHAGYMLLGAAVFTATGAAAVVFYAATYGLMNIGAFLVVMAVAEGSKGDESVSAFSGLGRRAPLVAGCMTIFLFSLTGLPPFAGFVGKLYIFSGLVQAGSGLGWTLAVVGVLNSVASLFYYARIVRSMYLDRVQEGETAMAVRLPFSVAAAALAVPTLALGVYWAPLYDAILTAMPLVR